MSDLSTKGWSWGTFETSDKSLDFSVDHQANFSLSYRDMANCTQTGKNELLLEFQQDDTMEEDIICEMRLFVPEADSCDRLNKEITEKANLRAYSGDAIVSLYDLSLLIPRGKYSIDMFNSFMRLHGKTHNYKIMYKNVKKGFLLPWPDGVHVSMVIGLETPIRQGNTLYPYVVVQFNKESQEEVELNMDPQEIQSNFGSEVSQQIQGRTYDVLSRLIKAITKISIVIPGNFRSAKNNYGIKCSYKANDGFLFPLQKSFVFINKPVVYVRFEDIRYIEFARISERSVSTNRSFDLNVMTKSGNFTFTGVDREEYQPLFGFLEMKKIPIRNLEEEEEQRVQAAVTNLDEEVEDESFEEYESD